MKKMREFLTGGWRDVPGARCGGMRRWQGDENDNIVSPDRAGGCSCANHRESVRKRKERKVSFDPLYAGLGAALAMYVFFSFFHSFGTC